MQNLGFFLILFEYDGHYYYYYKMHIFSFQLYLLQCYVNVCVFANLMNKNSCNFSSKNDQKIVFNYAKMDK